MAHSFSSEPSAGLRPLAPNHFAADPGREVLSIRSVIGTATNSQYGSNCEVERPVTGWSRSTARGQEQSLGLPNASGVVDILYTLLVAVTHDKARFVSPQCVRSLGMLSACNKFPGATCALR